MLKVLYTKRINKILQILLLITITCSLCVGCGKSNDEKLKIEGQPPEIGGLQFEEKTELQYAEGFDIYKYNDGYSVIEIYGSQKYLLVPEDKDIPDSLDSDIIVIKKPLENVYLAASSAMALFDSLDSLDRIGFSGTEASGWYIENTVTAMEEGKIVFAGKYSQPDYEMLVNNECSLAIESTMISHSPEVKEKLEELGIPVFVDYSSYEEHPLGRTEWIKLYGAMTDNEQKAEEFFRQQTEIVENLKDFENTEKKIAFFFINSADTVVVRTSDDYIPKMIEIAGGRYAFDNLKNTKSNSASVKISMEQFYEMAVDADYLIYNATIENPLKSLKELKGKSELFSEFKAVKEGNVWTTDKYLYQATDITGELINDINRMLMGKDEESMTFLMKVE